MPFCINCGKEVKGDTNFCSNCGASTRMSSAPVPPTSSYLQSLRPMAPNSYQYGGQANYPTSPYPYNPTVSRKQAKLLGFTHPQVLSIIAALACLIGAFLPWRTIYIASANGIDLGGGMITALLAILAMAIVYVTRDRIPSKSAYTILAIIGIIAILVAIANYPPGDSVAKAGDGIYITAAGGLALIVSGVWSLKRSSHPSDNLQSMSPPTNFPLPKKRTGDEKYLPILVVGVVVVIIGSIFGYYYNLSLEANDFEANDSNNLPWGSDGGNHTIAAKSYRWTDDMYNKNYRLFIINMNLTNDKDVSVLTSTYNLLIDDTSGKKCWFLTTSDGIVVNAYYISTPSLPDRLPAHTNYSFSVAFQVPNDISVTKLQYTNYWLSDQRFSIYISTIS